MDAARSKRDALLRKRELAQLRLKRRREAEFYRYLAPRLCTAGLTHFSRVPAVECLRLMTNFAHLPAQDERLVWWNIDSSHRAVWETGKERDDLLRVALEACTQANERLVVIQHTSEAGLSISAGDLIEAVPRVLEAAHETVWITARSFGQWLIEVSFTDKELCYAQHLI